ncbi:amino acid transporter [Aureobasidium namibiae CBS 147.97]|uniref:Amino acid transporter n=1 Tax=Aureobasidium namibiae CBS 147.97 TaxID=1043004 RepID=A0A074WDN3_9PEZI|nr:amino acid transporter [Aureobasidium namibiae CBS 147.97]KEQ68042.1 amino acid transporter [Aureobasidium namibiae CBS 147.97]
MALVGTIETGLFLRIESALTRGGPSSLVPGYTITGMFLYAMMPALGEMATWLPLPGATPQFCSRYVDDALGFAVGYNNWYAATFSGCSDLSATAIVIQYWNKEINLTRVLWPGVWITVILVSITLLDCICVGIFGEAEFALVTIKVFTLLGLLILALVVDLGCGSNAHRLGFQFWNDPGAINTYLTTGAFGRFLGWFSVLINASFSYVGIELVAVAAGETKNPRRNIPRAVRRTSGVFCSSTRLAASAPGAARSPWVIAIQGAGITGLPSLINAVILSSAISAANEWLFCASRYLYALAKLGKALPIFLRCTKRGIPWAGVWTTALILCVSYLDVSNSGSSVSNWLSSISAISNCFTWGSVSIAYLGFHRALKAQGIDRDSLPYKAPFQPCASYLALTFFATVIMFSGFSAFVYRFDRQEFITSYITIPIFFTLYFGHKLIRKTSLIGAKDVDLFSGKQEVDLDGELNDEVPPKNMVEKVLNWLFFRKRSPETQNASLDGLSG